MSTKIVVDPIHGDIHLSDLERRIVDTSVFQRLRRVKQLSMGHLTYPNATHTRFAHSLGVLKIMQRVIEVARRDNVYPIPQDTERQLRFAALLHDIGHYPYSHLMERIDKVLLTEDFVHGSDSSSEISADHIPYPDHEKIGGLVISKHAEIRDVIGGGTEAETVANLFRRTGAADRQLSKLIHSSLDMDRIDYLLRDARAAGVPYGEIDINYILNNFRVSPEGMLGVEAKALPATEQLLLARYFMYRTVYYHKTTVGLEEACRQLLRRLRNRAQYATGEKSYSMPVDGTRIEELVTSNELLEFDDAFVDRVIREAADDGDKVVQMLSRTILMRQPPRLLHEVAVLSKAPDEKHTAGTAFEQECRHRLADFSEKHGLPLGSFIFHRTPPLRFEVRARYISDDEARQLPPESDDEMVKVFTGDDVEPESIVNVGHSVLSHLSGLRFEFFRLYLADPDVDSSKVDQLRNEVRQWVSSRA